MADVFGPMAEYQATITQTAQWPSRSESTLAVPGVEYVSITDMHPAHATNALHKLGRWQDSLYAEATSAAYAEAQKTLYSSPLVAALIQQALGPFYEGTFLQETPPHVDDIAAAGMIRWHDKADNAASPGMEMVGRARHSAQPGEQLEVQLGNGWTEVGLKDALLSVAVDVLVAQAQSHLPGAGDQALFMRDTLYDRIHTYIV